MKISLTATDEGDERPTRQRRGEEQRRSHSDSKPDDTSSQRARREAASVGPTIPSRITGTITSSHIREPVVSALSSSLLASLRVARALASLPVVCRSYHPSLPAAMRMLPLCVIGCLVWLCSGRRRDGTAATATQHSTAAASDDTRAATTRNTTHTQEWMSGYQDDCNGLASTHCDNGRERDLLGGAAHAAAVATTRKQVDDGQDAEDEHEAQAQTRQAARRRPLFPSRAQWCSALSQTQASLCHAGVAALNRITAICLICRCLHALPCADLGRLWRDCGTTAAVVTRRTLPQPQPQAAQQQGHPPRSSCDACEQRARWRTAAAADPDSA